jgi:hypothetical protein
VATAVWNTVTNAVDHLSGKASVDAANAANTAKTKLAVADADYNRTNQIIEKGRDQKKQDGVTTYCATASAKNELTVETARLLDIKNNKNATPEDIANAQIALHTINPEFAKLEKTPPAPAPTTAK